MSLFSGTSKLIQSTVGNQRENRPQDVGRVKGALSELGYFDFQKEPEPHGYVTREMDAGIKHYQKDRGLRVDAWLKPGGETEIALLNDLKLRISDDIQREKLSGPNIPGTNIPDRGIPEGYVTPDWIMKQMDQFRYSFDRQIEKTPPAIDPGILLPYDPDNPRVQKSRKKDRDL